uniref:Uncharacterized protein n=1 Tax=Anguilla anguilla TaxID=7936 RepID=A0A0E9XGE2_ANGAN
MVICSEAQNADAFAQFPFLSPPLGGFYFPPHLQSNDDPTCPGNNGYCPCILSDKPSLFQNLLESPVH